MKLNLYSRQGVQEYWIVDRADESIQVYRRSDTVLSLAVTLSPGDLLSSPLLHGFSCPSDRFFAVPGTA